MGKFVLTALTALSVSAVLFVFYLAGQVFDMYFRLMEMSIYGE